jgi:hypothetical protein
LLTPPASPKQDQAQQELIDRLTGLIGGPGLAVVLIMRDDFYPRLAARAPALLQALTHGLVNAPATLSMQDLRDIITRPAEAVGIACQDGLTDRIVADVLATDPGAALTRQAPTTVLPLLELTLQQLWQRRSDGRLTHEAYQRVGGVAGGLTAWCDTALEQLPPARQHIAQRLLTALVRPADETHGVPAVRQQVPLATLRELADATEPTAADEVLAVLTAHRVVTTRTTARSHGHDPVPVAELVHDALIRDWAPCAAGSTRTTASRTGYAAPVNSRPAGQPAATRVTCCAAPTSPRASNGRRSAGCRRSRTGFWPPAGGSNSPGSAAPAASRQSWPPCSWWRSPPPAWPCGSGRPRPRPSGSPCHGSSPPSPRLWSTSISTWPPCSASRPTAPARPTRR